MRINTLDKVTGVAQYGREQKITKDIPRRIFKLKNKREPKIKSVLDHVPNGATHQYGGYFFKYGSHGFVFIWENSTRTWQRTEQELRQHMRI